MRMLEREAGDVAVSLPVSINDQSTGTPMERASEKGKSGDRRGDVG